jgi:hypothetical protein
MTLPILVACEESQALTKEFRSLGLEAYSCDIQPCSGGCPDWHIEGDAIQEAYSGKYIAMIAFPPCTHLAVSGAAWFEQKRKDGRQQEGIDFFMKIINAPIKHIAVENPIGIMSKIYKKPTQVIQPYYFGDKAQKTTCLWLKNLPMLYHNDKPNLFDQNVTHVKPDGNVIYGNKMYSWAANKWYKNAEERSRERSKTFPGIAKAMAQQWSEYILKINL